MTERELERRARRRLAVLRHVEEVSGNVAATCRYYGISRQCYYSWLRRYQADGRCEPRNSPVGREPVRVVQLVGGSLGATPATRLAVTMYPAIGLCGSGPRHRSASSSTAGPVPCLGDRESYRASNARSGPTLSQAASTQMHPGLVLGTDEPESFGWMLASGPSPTTP
jgi:transposase-like protein